MIDQLIADFKKLSNPIQAKNLSRFFKTGKGEYGEGDIFLGIKVPEQRELVRKYYKDLKIKDAEELLRSKIHEHRLTALLILVAKYKKADQDGKKKVFDLYLKNTKFINNWDLVDLSSRDIIGNYLLDKDKKILYKLAKSKDLWEKRISIISTFEFIRYHKFDDVLKIAEILLHDKHDLIHKAVGWMLREMGKRSQEIEEEFLEKHCKEMPRTMLRYAIEKFDEKKRKHFMA